MMISIQCLSGVNGLKARGKYNKEGIAKSNIFSDLNVDPRFVKGLAEAANLAISENTKSQYRTAMNHVTRCREYTGKEMLFPFDLTSTLNYIGYLQEVRKVSSNTVSQYLSALRYIHLVQGQDPSCLRPDIVSLILRGREHWEQVEKTLEGKVRRVAVTVPLMKHIKKSLVLMQILEVDKLMIWSVCCLMFCGSLRVHEALSRTNEACPQSTLLAKDLQIVDISLEGSMKTIIKLRIKSPKENRVGAGICLEIFENKTFMCPVKSIRKWLSKAEVPSKLPLFRYQDGKPFKGKDLNRILSDITKPFTKDSTGIIRAHSFRAAISTEMGLRGFSNTEIQAQGRWSSAAFKAYLKQDPVKRLHFTEKWINRIVNDNS